MERALNGEKVINRKGEVVSGITKRKEPLCNGKYVIQVGSFSFTESGRFSCNQDYDIDLFMAEPSAEQTLPLRMDRHDRSSKLNTYS